MTASSRSFLLAAMALAAAGCGDAGEPSGAPDTTPDASVADVVAPLPDADAAVSADGATDVEDEEVLYVGYLCERDDECSTGYCYGVATPQGAFEPAECQIGCLQLNDFRRYCDSDRDCCSGRCCLDCGAKEGLCVLALPSGTEN
jgi:hypothetical protein